MNPRERVQRALAAIQAADDPACHISLHARERLLAMADAVDPAAPLAGMVFSVKDNIDVIGLQTTAGCPAYAYWPEQNALAIQRLVVAGAVCIGKTNLDQFATGLVGTRSPYGIPRNDRAPGHIPGGSSSGSAVSVARGEVDFALGTDTAGSGRVPAAFNGIVGCKPSCGLVSSRGVVPAVRSIDCVTILARDCILAKTVLATMAVYDPADPFSRRLLPRIGPAHPSVAVLDERWLARCDAPVRVAYQRSLDRARGLGWQLQELDYEPLAEAAALLYEGPLVAERTAAVGDFIRDHLDACDPTVAEIITGGFRYPAVQAYLAQYRLFELRRWLEQRWQHDWDMILLPTTPCHPTLEEVDNDKMAVNTRLGTFTNFANLLDTAAVAVPGVARADGLPAGVTCFGPAFSDDWLLHRAADLHTACL
ncbi:MAG: allophanate hydrolase [Planctomycetota bacterium]